MVVCASEVDALVIKERNPIQVSDAPISNLVNIQAYGSQDSPSHPSVQLTGSDFY